MITFGSTVDIIGEEYQNHNLLVNYANVVEDNNNGTFEVRVYSTINGFIVLHGVKREHLNLSKLY